MTTITDEIGTSPPIIAAEDGQRRSASIGSEALGHVVALTGQRVWRDYALRPDAPAKTGTPVGALDSGPKPANDNVPAKLERYHLKEMYERGELGINEMENRRHWFAAQRLKTELAIADGDPVEANDWRELRLPFLEGFSGDISSVDTDDALALSDELEFEDTDTPAECGVVDNVDDTPTALRILYAREVTDLAADVLGDDFELLRAVIARNWTARMVGETEGFTDRASASACGKGMLRAALRNLSRFYAGLDRLEEKGERPHDRWPLVGTLNWPAVAYPPNSGGRCASYWNQARGPVIKVAA
ncbi:hypothetical protein ACNJX9_25360 [Bradyrhizobium sp. DASA03076]|uniref:hypothetical protein n=1 Tax=Bradyrhizobium sp. BLXBL-03 TaxID=3395916 RepID=UPI003F6E8AC7